MRATYAMLLVGLMLASTLLVPYDLLSQGSPTHAISRPASVAPSGPQVPPGKVLIHFPDYWSGAVQATLFAKKIYLPGNLGLSPAAYTLRLDPAMLVYPGARWLNVSVDAPSLPQDATFDFEYQTADDRRGLRVVPNHGSYSLPLEEAMNDWSPDTFTRWTLRLYNNAVDGAEAKVNVTVARNPGLMPSHILVNERWNNDDVRVVFDQKDRLRAANVARQSVPVPDNKGPASSAQLRGVPALDLKEITVHLYYNSSTPTDLHFRPFLTWDSPRTDQNEYARSNLAPTQEQRGSSGHFLWRIPVTPEMYDSVLGTRSRWRVDVNWYGNNTENREYYMEGDYHFQVRAHRGLDDPEPAARPS